MQTIIVLLNPGMLENADLDLRYRIPDRIEEVSNSLIQSNGYDYIDTEDGEPGPLMGIWLETENAHKNGHIVRDLFCKRLIFRYDRKNPRLLFSSRSTLTVHI